MHAVCSVCYALWTPTAHHRSRWYAVVLVLEVLCLCSVLNTANSTHYSTTQYKLCQCSTLTLACNYDPMLCCWDLTQHWTTLSDIIITDFILTDISLHGHNLNYSRSNGLEKFSKFWLIFPNFHNEGRTIFVRFIFGVWTYLNYSCTMCSILNAITGLQLLS